MKQIGMTVNRIVIAAAAGLAAPPGPYVLDASCDLV
jgi:hypothetical protein